MRENFLVFGQPDLGQEEINEVVDSMQKSWIGTGPKVQRFEEDFTRYKGVEYGAALNSCTAALHLSLNSLGLKQGDEVITTSMTFCATVNAIIHAGGKPVIVDIDPNTLNIDPEEIVRKINSRTKAILVVHFAGVPCDMDPIMLLAKKNGLSVIEDCAHAIETEYKEQKAGTFGELSCFSFYATKNLVTGEGGMVLSADKEKIKRIKMTALHGMSLDAWRRFSDDGYKHYFVEEAGFKYNMMDLQAAIGIHQLKAVDQKWEKRRIIWGRYQKELEDQPISLPRFPDYPIKHAYHLYTLRIDSKRTNISRDDFLMEMHKRNIGCGVHYLAIPEHPFYQRTYNWKPTDYPNAIKYGRETVSIPLSPKLTDEDVNDVIDAIKVILKQHKK